LALDFDIPRVQMHDVVRIHFQFTKCTRRTRFLCGQAASWICESSTVVKTCPSSISRSTVSLRSVGLAFKARAMSPTKKPSEFGGSDVKYCTIWSANGENRDAALAGRVCTAYAESVLAVPCSCPAPVG
jgi:hypothetical protein